MRANQSCILIFLFFTTLNYCQKGTYYFDFNKEEVICFLGEFEVEKLNNSNITFSDKEGFIGDDTLFDYRRDNFNYDGIYRVKFKGNNNYSYFKFSSQSFKNNKTRFYNVLRWIKNPPSHTYKNVKLQFYLVHIPFEQKGHIRFSTIGDSQTRYSKGQSLRKLISEKTSGNLKFVGTRQDVYGFFHSGEGGDRSIDVINRMEDIPVADIYSVFIGTNDWRKNNHEETFQNILEILAALKDKNHNAEVYLTTIPNSLDLLRKEPYRSEVNMRVNQKMLDCQGDFKQEKIYIVDLAKAIKEKGLQKYLLNDGLHLNDKGYELYTDLLIQTILENTNHKLK